MRIGHGFDAHRFGPGDHVVIGGTTIPYSQGLVAHSDGDVLVHALCDALLGATALGDIGRHFPDTSNEFKAIDSRILLRKVIALIHGRGFRVGNADITLVAEAPKMAPHLSAMVANLALDLNVGQDQINIKATTTEGMGYTGRGEGISCHVVVLVIPV